MGIIVTKDGTDIYAECGSGWHQIIEETHEKLRWLDPDYHISQIKEKFGGLRYYYSPSVSTDRICGRIMDDVVDHAEFLCSRTCESCGTDRYDANVETREYRHWWYTYCEACSDNRIKEIEERNRRADEETV